MHVVKEICHRVAVMEKEKLLKKENCLMFSHNQKQRRLKTLYVLLLMIIYRKVF